jgi:hypothetical protein
MLIETGSNGWRKTEGIGSPEGSNGTDSLISRIDPIYRRHGMVGSPGEGRSGTLQIGNPRQGVIKGSPC